MSGPTEFRVLGQLDVFIDRERVPIAAAKLRVLLAALLLRPNEAVRADQLATRLWGENLPRTARATLQTYVQRLRRVLRSEDRLVTTPAGYLIRVAPDELDLIRFRRSVERGARLADLAERVETLRQALDEWRGTPLSNVSSSSMQMEDLPPLEEERLQTLERLFDAELELGNHRAIIRELQQITTELPLNERFGGQLMLALYRSGRQADAFAAFERLKTALAEQLGVDPSTELRDVYQTILGTSPGTAAQPARAGSATGPTTRAASVPRELPRHVNGFVGRERISEKIKEILVPGTRREMAIVHISGAPGIGKTALAVHVGHEIDEHFPDGQLYADLRGHADTPALEPAEVLAKFVIALGVPAKQVPSSLELLETFYRTALADRRVLVVLDNAASAQQVRPLLPSSRDCAVIVTSRRELRGLTALEGATPFRPGVLSADQSRQLLAAIIGPDRVAAEAEAAAELADLCGHLPLALRIAAANVAVGDRYTVTGFVAELRGGNRLRSLEIDGDAAATVRATFGLSYSSLDPDSASTFRLLALVPGPHFTTEAIAALQELPEEHVAHQLDVLAVANLVIPRGESRYALHDLLRLYATEQCAHEDESAIQAAKRRLLGFYLRHTLAAADLLYPIWSRLPLPDESYAPTGSEFGEVAEATAWMDAECPNVLAAINEAVTAGFSRWAWPMAEALRSYLVTRGRYRHEGRHSCAVALAAATDEGEYQAQAAMHSTISSLCMRHGELSAAREHMRAALAAYRTSGLAHGEARTHIALGNAYQQAGQLNDAADSITMGLRLAGRIGHRPLRRFGLLNLGFVERHRGNLDRAEECVRELLNQAGIGGEQVSTGEASSVLGEILLLRGHCGQAIARFTDILELYRRGSISHYEASILGHLADAHRERGDWPEARRHAEEAVSVAENSGASDETVEALISLGAVHRALGEHERANERYERALGIGRDSDMRRCITSSLLGCAEGAQLAGELAQARSLAHEALVTSREAGMRIGYGQALAVMSSITLSEGNHVDAVAMASEAAAVHEEIGAVLEEARSLHRLGTALLAGEDGRRAETCWAKARFRLKDAEVTESAELWRLLDHADTPARARARKLPAR